MEVGFLKRKKEKERGKGMGERIDIYDANRRLTGETKDRKTSKLADDEYMLYALALIEDLNGNYLITQRKANKKWAALWWEIPGGGCHAGEDSRQGINREVLEETGLDVSGLTPVSVYSYVNHDAESHDNYFCDIYHFQLDFSIEDVTLQVEETEDGAIASIEEIKKEGSKGTFLHYQRIREALMAESHTSIIS